MSKKIVKRSLALGALMAFVITGSAMAANIEAKGSHVVVTENDHLTEEDKIIGGANYEGVSGSGSFDGTTFSKYSTKITLESGKCDEIIGGSHIKNIKVTLFPNNVVEIGDTDVLVKGGTVSGSVIGGSKVNNVRDIILNTGNTKVVIEGGNINGDVIGGNYIKAANNSNSGQNLAQNSSSTISSTVIINGGTINGNVFAGSVVHTYESKSQNDISLSATNAKASLEINGGTFNGNIFGAGAAIGEGTSASVTNVVMDIKEMTVANDAEVNIYTGGLVVNDTSYTSPTKQPVLTATNADVKISDSAVTNIFASNAVASSGNDNKGGTGSTIENEKGSNVSTDLTLKNVTATGIVEVQQGSVVLSATATGQTSITTLTAGQGVDVEMVADGDTTDALNGDAKAFASKINIETYQTTNENGATQEANKSDIKGTMQAGKVVGDVAFTLNADGDVESSNENVNTANLAISDMAAIGLMSWRAETNDMNKRMGELRNANGEHGVWVRMVRGEDEYGNVKNQYNQYQLGYDEKLSVDKHWTVGAALSYTDAESSFAQGSGESTNKALSIYGSKLNEDGTFIDLIAKYARLENDFVVNGGAGDADYSTNGYSFSAEFGKRIQQDKGLWIEPQVELTYGKVASVDYVTKDGVTVAQNGMDSFIGRVGFSLGKDIKQGNIYARASYLYDFDGETGVSMTDKTTGTTRGFSDDLGGGWWEVGVGANINLSDATYIYADVEKTFGGEVDTNWQWNLGVRYSF